MKSLLDLLFAFKFLSFQKVGFVLQLVEITPNSVIDQIVEQWLERIVFHWTLWKAFTSTPSYSKASEEQRFSSSTQLAAATANKRNLFNLKFF